MPSHRRDISGKLCNADDSGAYIAKWDPQLTAAFAVDFYDRFGYDRPRSTH